MGEEGMNEHRIEKNTQKVCCTLILLCSDTSLITVQCYIVGRSCIVPCHYVGARGLYSLVYCATAS
jgi:hypothetical protein